VNRRLPIVPTVLVVAAAATMVWLGVWQLHRARWKEGLLAQYAAASTMPPVTWPIANSGDPPLFRRASGHCASPRLDRTAPGENKAGDSGYAFIVTCSSGGSVAIGWSQNPNAAVDWAGGPVSGIVAPDSRTSMRLVADRAPASLQALKPPSLDSIPNNHRFYALQWFVFAALALLIYVLALRSRWTDRP
jgi:surfeit locus 1 family protein